MTERYTDDLGYDEGAILNEAGAGTSHAIALLYDRVMRGLNPDGAIDVNVKHKRGIEQIDGTIVPMGDMASAHVKEDPFYWRLENTATGFTT